VHLIDPFALAEVYPDARFVLTHRDPVNVIASACNLVRVLAGTFTDADWTAYIRETWPEIIGTLLDNQNAFRDSQIAAGRADAFVDLAYSDLVADPISTIGALYEQLGATFTPQAEQAMRAHSAEHKKDRFGSHSYSLEEWGLDRDELTERVQPYLTRYADFLE
jgi:LPS sulfotransferase NodH